jgi:hypothetical protein
LCDQGRRLGESIPERNGLTPCAKRKENHREHHLSVSIYAIHSSMSTTTSTAAAPSQYAGRPLFFCIMLPADNSRLPFIFIRPFLDARQPATTVGMPHAKRRRQAGVEEDDPYLRFELTCLHNRSRYICPLCCVAKPTPVKIGQSKIFVATVSIMR